MRSFFIEFVVAAFVCEGQLFQLVAGGLLFVCTWIVLQYFSTSCEFANFYLLIPLGVIGVVGVLLFLNSFVGCCGAVRESKCCLSVVSLPPVKVKYLKFMRILQ